MAGFTLAVRSQTPARSGSCLPLALELVAARILTRARDDAGNAGAGGTSSAGSGGASGASGSAARAALARPAMIAGWCAAVTLAAISRTIPKLRGVRACLPIDELCAAARASVPGMHGRASARELQHLLAVTHVALTGRFAGNPLGGRVSGRNAGLLRGSCRWYAALSCPTSHMRAAAPSCQRRAASMAEHARTPRGFWDSSRKLRQRPCSTLARDHVRSSKCLLSPGCKSAHRCSASCPRSTCRRSGIAPVVSDAV